MGEQGLGKSAQRMDAMTRDELEAYVVRLEGRVELALRRNDELAEWLKARIARHVDDIQQLAEERASANEYAGKLELCTAERHELRQELAHTRKQRDANLEQYERVHGELLAALAKLAEHAEMRKRWSSEVHTLRVKIDGLQRRLDDTIDDKSDLLRALQECRQERDEHAEQVKLLSKQLARLGYDHERLRALREVAGATEVREWVALGQWGETLCTVQAQDTLRARLRAYRILVDWQRNAQSPARGRLVRWERWGRVVMPVAIADEMRHEMIVRETPTDRVALVSTLEIAYRAYLRVCADIDAEGGRLDGYLRSAHELKHKLDYMRVCGYAPDEHDAPTPPLF